MNISVEIKATDLANAIQALANALGGKLESPTKKQIEQPQNVIQPQQPVLEATSPVPVQQETAQQSTTAVPTAPVQQPTAQQVPTSAPAYTMDQLAVAATQLMDAGKQPELLQLLASFNAQSLMQLPHEQYGAFATKLRELGAKI